MARARANEKRYCRKNQRMQGITQEPVSDDRILASDLDGTFIPLSGDRQNQVDLRTLELQLRAHNVTLVFVSGRHFELVEQAIHEFQLPHPNWIICDVGTSIRRRLETGGYEPVVPYEQHQNQIIAPFPILTLRERLQTTPGLRLQEEEKQGPFKLSFYAEAARLDELVHGIQKVLVQCQAPYSIIHSVDPFNGDGLIDLLPAGVSKSHALEWWCEYAGARAGSIVFAGDSGNDWAPLTAGYRAILVGNADRQLARQVFIAHRESGTSDHLYLARAPATSGVLEGCRWFGLIEPDDPPQHRLGATPVSHRTTYFRVWAPHRQQVAVEVQTGGGSTRTPLMPTDDGYFTGNVADVAPPGPLSIRLGRPGRASRPSCQISAPGRAWPVADRGFRGLSLDRPAVAGCGETRPRRLRAARGRSYPGRDFSRRDQAAR